LTFSALHNAVLYNKFQGQDCSSAEQGRNHILEALGSKLQSK